MWRGAAKLFTREAAGFPWGFKSSHADHPRKAKRPPPSLHPHTPDPLHKKLKKCTRSFARVLRRSTAYEILYTYTWCVRAEYTCYESAEGTIRKTRALFSRTPRLFTITTPPKPIVRKHHKTIDPCQAGGEYGKTGAPRYWPPSQQKPVWMFWESMTRLRMERRDGVHHHSLLVGDVVDAMRPLNREPGSAESLSAGLL